MGGVLQDWPALPRNGFNEPLSSLPHLLLIVHADRGQWPLMGCQRCHIHPHPGSEDSHGATAHQSFPPTQQQCLVPGGDTGEGAGTCRMLGEP